MFPSGRVSQWMMADREKPGTQKHLNQRTSKNHFTLIGCFELSSSDLVHARNECRTRSAERPWLAEASWIDKAFGHSEPWLRWVAKTKGFMGQGLTCARAKLK